MSRELRELLEEFDAYGPSEGVYQVATERARVLTGTSGSRLPKVGRVFAIGAAVAALTACIVLLALAAHSRATLRPDKEPTSPARPLTQTELDVFLNRVAPRVSQLQLDIMLARQDLNIYAANPTTTAGPKRSATALGDRLVHVAIDQIGASDYASLTAVTAPRELAVAWSTFLHGVKETATAARVGGFDLQENKLPYARNGKRAYFAHLEQPILRLKVALTAYAARNHFRLPPWVDKLGTGT